MRRVSVMPPAHEHSRRLLLLSIIAMSLLSTVVSWWVMDVHSHATSALHGVHLVCMPVLAALLLATWRRWLPQRVVEMICLLFGVLMCALCMALCLYWPRYGAGIDLQPLYLWIPVMYVFAFALADSRTGLRLSLGILALFLAVSLPYLWHDIDAPYANFTVQLHVVSAALVAALYFFAGYQRHLQLAQLTVDELAQLSQTDELTRLPNRRHLGALLQAELGRVAREGGRLAVLLFDLDHFKAINDEHGHDTGDEALRALAIRAAQGIRDGDVLGRWGGDEFVALLPHLDADEALGRTRALCDHVAATPLHGSLRATISCGVAVAQPGDNGDSLLRRADAALYAAKRAGRNQAAGAVAGDGAAAPRPERRVSG